MTQQLIITTPANTGTGDSPKSAFDKCNANFTDIYTGGLAFFGPTAVETAVIGSAAVQNTAIPSHLQLGYILLERFVPSGTNTSTTDMGVAFNLAIQIALATSGSGKYGIPIRFQAGAYLITTQPNFGAAGTANILPVDIGGAGEGTQLIINTVANSSYLFPMNGFNGFYLHDFSIYGNDAHKNGGIQVSTISGADNIEWRIARVTSYVPGIGFYVADTNTGAIDQCRHWPGNNETCIIPQTVSAANISHGVYMTGNFVHNVKITNGVFNSNSNYGISAGVSTMRGIKMDCTFSYACVIDGAPLCQTLSGNLNEIGPDITPANSAQSLILTGLYGEGSTVRLNNVVNSFIGPVNAGNVAGGALRLDGTCRFNTFTGVYTGILDITDTSGAAQGNTFIGCGFYLGAAAYNAGVTYTVGNYVSSGGVQYRCIATTTGNAPPNATFWTVCQQYNDAEEATNLSAAPNRLLGSAVNVGNGATFVADSNPAGWRKSVAWSAAITLPGPYGANHSVINVPVGGLATNFSVSVPSPARNTADVTVTVANKSTGALGTITWPVTVGGWVNPANGFSRSICFYYDSDQGSYEVKWVGTVDQPNH